MNSLATRAPRVGGGLFVIGMVLLLFAASLSASAGPNDKVTICHASGNGTDQFRTLTISSDAVYGNGGHFNSNGTPQVDHESDYMGPCTEEDSSTTTIPEGPTTTVSGETTTTVPEETSTTTPSEETTTTVAVEVTTTTTVPETTTTTVPETTTTTVPETTTTTVPETTTTTVPETTTTTVSGVTITTPSVETTTTTVAEETTTTSVLAAVVDTTSTTGPETAASGIAESPEPSGEPSEHAPTASMDVEPNADDSVGIDSLPFTGFGAFLAIPGLLLLIVGAMAVAVGWGFGGTGRAHMATEQGRISLGFHRGRHESSGP